jgi:hypothetical protein
LPVVAARPQQTTRQSKTRKRPTTQPAKTASETNPAGFARPRPYQCTAQDWQLKRCDHGTPISRKIG